MKQGNRGEADFTLLLPSLCFLAGGILGCLAEGRWLSQSPTDVFLSEAAAGGVAGPPLWRELWVLLRWPVFALAAASLPLSGLTMPMLFCLRGFFLSYGISAFMSESSSGGWPAGIILYGPSCFLALPVFFVLGTVGLQKKKAEGNLTNRVATALICSSALLLCALLDCRAAPILLHAVLTANTVS